MTQDEFLKNGNKIDSVEDGVVELKKAIEDAPKDTTPYSANTNDKQFVVGDVTKTDKKEKEYSLTFLLPADIASKYGIENPKVTGSYVTLSFKEGLINPVSEMRIREALVVLLPYFVKVEDKKVEQISDDEITERFIDMPDKYMVLIASTAAKIFNVDDEIASYVTIPSALMAVLNFVRNNPEYINGADFT